MANTLALVDSRAQVTVFYLNLHDVKAKVGNKLTKQFNLEIALFDPA
jgi:predicted lipoprotein